jgi:SAM-dependent methyltransferase
VKAEVLELLRSPDDGSELIVEGSEQEGDEITSGVLADRSGNRFPIIGGVPRFAEQLGDDETFAFKWKLIGDSYGHDEPTRTIRRRWYLDRFGHADEQALSSQIEGLRVLDAGCGSGADAAMFADAGATVVAVDLSTQAAESVYRRLGHRANVHVVQGDLQRLPFTVAGFDFVSCDQVLHHTPDTRESFGKLARHLVPGGRIAIYVYNQKGPIREYADDFIRSHATQMSADECWSLCRSLTLLGEALTKVRAEVDVPEPIPLLGIQAGREDVQRFVYWNVLKCFWNEEFDFETNVIVNFDWYHPRYAYRHTLDEVRGWFEELGLEIQLLEDVRSGIAAVGVRPS